MLFVFDNFIKGFQVSNTDHIPIFVETSVIYLSFVYLWLIVKLKIWLGISVINT